MNERVPEGWAISNLDDAIDILSGFPFKSSEFTNDPSDFGLIRIRNLLGQELETFYSGEYSDDFVVQVGDILIGMDGDFHIVKWKSKNALLNQRICKLVPKQGGFDINFVHYFLIPELQKIHNQTTATTVKHLSVKDIREVEQAFPPLPEQKKIASILTSVDEVIETTQKQIDKLQDLKKATMNELLTKGIGHTEFKDSELGRIPKSWEVVSLDKVCKVRQGLQIPIRDRFKDAATGRYPYLTVSWINSKFDIIKAEFIANPNNSVVLKSNEFVVGRTGAVGQIFDGLECVFHNNFFAVSLLTDSVEKEFLKHFLKWHTTQDLLLKLAGSTTIPDLNHGDFYSIKISLPPVEEQYRVVSQVDSIDITLREIRLKLNALISLKKSLMQDLLTGKVRVQVN